MADIFVPLYGFTAFTNGAVNSLVTIIPVDATVTAYVDSKLSAVLPDTGITEISLSDGTSYEIVKVVGTDPSGLLVLRAQEGTTASAFPMGACISFVWASYGINYVVTTPALPLTIAGTGLAESTYDTLTNTWTVNVDPLVLTGDSPITILGEWPEIVVAFDGVYPGCCGCGTGSGGGSGGVTTITGTGLVNVTGGGATYNIGVLAPNFTALGGGISIAGSWPNYTFTVPTPSFSGVNSITASAPLVQGGTPTNVTLGFAPSGIAAGTYLGFTIDMYGRATAFNSSYIPLTSLTSANASITVSGSLGVLVITANDATTAAKGVVKLAAPTAVASADPSDTTSAVVPAGVAAVIANLPAGAKGGTQGTYTADAFGLYTALIGTSGTIAITAGRKVVFAASATVYDDDVSVVTPMKWGLAAFRTDTTAMVAGVKAVYTGTHTMYFELAGPFAGAVELKAYYVGAIGTPQVVGVGVHMVDTIV